MRFGFTDDQRLLAEAVRETLAKACPPDAVRAARSDPAARRGTAWRALAEIGLLGAHVPEKYGGLGLTPVDTVLAHEEIGRAAVPGPIVETAVAAPLILERLRDDDEATGRLPKIATGETAVSVRTEEMPYLLDADLADLLIVQYSTAASVAPRAEATLTPRPSADPTRRLFADDLGHDGETFLCWADGPEGLRPVFARAFDHAALAVAAQLVGAARRLLDDAVAYAKQRHQFGRAIGSFQAVKHQLADVAIAVEFAAPMVYRAALALAEGVPTASRDVSAAKVTAGSAAHRAARTALQVHGAIGYTDELDLHLWLNRVWALRTAWGDDRLHRARLRAALLEGEAVRWP
jgi:alkylation response protein AidB-like acyl-CoA dehydrogenase